MEKCKECVYQKRAVEWVTAFEERLIELAWMDQECMDAVDRFAFYRPWGFKSLTCVIQTPQIKFGLYF